jgi:Flp pilus assembly protein TadD
VRSLQAWTNLGVLLREANDLAGAQRALQQALAHAPAHPVVLANLAALYVLVGNQGGAEARASYERALAYEPSNTDALYNIGVLEGTAEHYEAALFFYQTCVRLAPKHALAWNNLGVIYQQVPAPGRVVNETWLEHLAGAQTPSYPVVTSVSVFDVGACPTRGQGESEMWCRCTTWSAQSSAMRQQSPQSRISGSV